MSSQSERHMTPTGLTREEFVEQLKSLGWHGNNKHVSTILAHDAALRARVEEFEKREHLKVGDYAIRLTGLTIERDSQDKLINALTAQLAQATETIAKREKTLDEVTRWGQNEAAIVDRVWKALGITTYEQAGGKSIDEIVSALRASQQQATEREASAQKAAIHAQEIASDSLNREHVLMLEVAQLKRREGELVGALAESLTYWKSALDEFEMRVDDPDGEDVQWMDAHHVTKENTETYQPTAKHKEGGALMNSLGRRSCVDLLTPEELKIRDAAIAVENLGPHPLLTSTTALLWQAKDKLADYIDGKYPSDESPAPEGKGTR